MVDWVGPNMRKAMELTFEMYSRTLAPRRFNVVDTLTAINSLKPHKAVGWPWDLKFKDKMDYWSSPTFINFFPAYWESLSTDSPFWLYSTIMIKNEIRPPEKRETPRIIFCSDVNHVIAGRRIFGELLDALIESHTEIFTGEFWSAVGMTPFHKSFDHLAFMANGANCVETDGSEWEASMSIWIFDILEELFQRLLSYDDFGRKRVSNYFKTTRIQMCVMPDGHIFLKYGGNPSGQALTTPMNTMWTILHMIHNIVCQWGRAITLDSMLQFVHCIAFGDDCNAMFWHDYNLQKHAVISMVCFNIKFTLSTFTDLVNLKWMNLTWRRHEGIWMPCLDTEKVLNSLFVHGTNEPRKALERVLGLRICSYGNPPLFEWLDEYTRWLFDRYPSLLFMRSAYHSRSDLSDLYHGRIRTPYVGISNLGSAEHMAQLAIQENVIGLSDSAPDVEF